MKLRFLFGFLAVFTVITAAAAIVPAQAHAATAVTLSAADRSNIQATLNATKAALDAVQVQINHNAVQDKAAMIVTLNGIKSYLIGIRTLLGNTSAAAVPAATAPVATVQAPAPAATAQPSAEAPKPSVAAAPARDQETASVSKSLTSKWALWIILVAAVLIAIVLIIPRKKTGSADLNQAQPVTNTTRQQPASEDTHPIQSA